VERPSAPNARGGEVLPPGAQPLASDDPVVIDGHRLVGRLSSGGTSVIYLARDADGEHVVVKTTRARKADQAQARRWLRTEASCARRLPPFCTAKPLADGTDHSPPYLVSEYIEGPSLTQFVEGLGPLEPVQLMALGGALARALAAIHGAGLIHCDLKPANIMLAANGPRVIDFSIAQEAPISGRPAEVGTVPYSPGWVAPERASGYPAAPSSDVFGWGCVIGYAATGRSPFEEGDGTEGAVRTAALDALEEPLRTLVEAALAVDPADRPSVGEIVSRLGPDGQREARTAKSRSDVPERRSLSSVDAPTAPMPVLRDEDDPRESAAVAPLSPFEPVARADAHPRRLEHAVETGEVALGSTPVGDRRPRDAGDGTAVRPLTTTTGGHHRPPAEHAAGGAAVVYSSNAMTGEHHRPPAPRTDPPPRRVEYSAETATAARQHAGTERRPRRLRTVAMVAGPAVAVAALATVIAMASTGTGRQEQQANPAGAASPGGDAPAVDPKVPTLSGPRSHGPHHASASSSRGSGTPTPSRHARHKKPGAPAGPGKPRPPASHPPTPPPPTHTPTPSPTPTPTGTGAPQG
jgi:tRNA A-37 threonylcarbamoyl transferase component Bud32